MSKDRCGDSLSPRKMSNEAVEHSLNGNHADGVTDSNIITAAELEAMKARFREDFEKLAEDRADAKKLCVSLQAKCSALENELRKAHATEIKTEVSSNFSSGADENEKMRELSQVAKRWKSKCANLSEELDEVKKRYREGTEILASKEAEAAKNLKMSQKAKILLEKAVEKIREKDESINKLKASISQPLLPSELSRDLNCCMDKLNALRRESCSKLSEVSTSQDADFERVATDLEVCLKKIMAVLDVEDSKPNAISSSLVSASPTTDIRNMEELLKFKEDHENMIREAQQAIDGLAEATKTHRVTFSRTIGDVGSENIYSQDLLSIDKKEKPQQTSHLANLDLAQLQQELIGLDESLKIFSVQYESLKANLETQKQSAAAEQLKLSDRIKILDNSMHQNEKEVRDLRDELEKKIIESDETSGQLETLRGTVVNIGRECEMAAEGFATTSSVQNDIVLNRETALSQDFLFEPIVFCVRLLQRLKTDFKNLESDLRDSREQLAKRNMEDESSTSVIDSLRDEIETVRNERDTLQESFSEQVQKIDAYYGQIGSLSEQIEMLKKQLTNEAESHKNFLAELSEKTSKIRELEENLAKQTTVEEKLSATLEEKIRFINKLQSCVALNALEPVDNEKEDFAEEQETMIETEHLSDVQDAFGKIMPDSQVGEVRNSRELLSSLQLLSKEQKEELEYLRQSLDEHSQSEQKLKDQIANQNAEMKQMKELIDNARELSSKCTTQQENINELETLLEQEKEANEILNDKICHLAEKHDDCKTIIEEFEKKIAVQSNEMRDHDALNVEIINLKRENQEKIDLRAETLRNNHEKEMEVVREEHVAEIKKLEEKLELSESQLASLEASLKSRYKKSLEEATNNFDKEYAQRISNLEAKLSKANQEGEFLLEVQEKLQTVETELRSRCEELEKSKAEFETVKRENSKLSKEKKSIVEKSKIMIRQHLDDAEAKFKILAGDLEDRLKLSESSEKSLKKRNEKLEEAIARAEADSKNCHDEIFTQREELNLQLKRTREAQDLNRNLQNEFNLYKQRTALKMQEYKEKIDIISEDKASLETSGTAATEELKKLAKKLSDAKANAESTDIALVEVKGILEETKCLKGEADSRVRELEATVQSLRLENVSGLANIREQSADTIKSLERDVCDLRKEIKSRTENARSLLALKDQELESKNEQIDALRKESDLRNKEWERKMRDGGEFRIVELASAQARRDKEFKVLEKKQQVLERELVTRTEELHEALRNTNLPEDQTAIVTPSVVRSRNESDGPSDTYSEEYLKNVMIKFLCTVNKDEKVQLVNVIGTILRFSSEEFENVNKSRGHEGDGKSGTLFGYFF